MKFHLTYNGTKLSWTGKGSFKASSGIDEEGTDYRNSKFQNKADKGPIPQGKYYILLEEEKKSRGFAVIADKVSCGLRVSTKLQRIPRGKRVGGCEGYLANWGSNRIKLLVYRGTTTFSRKGFYIHDSTKGFSHGCIETEKRFFNLLRNFIRENEKQPKGKRLRKLNVLVKYPTSDTSTNGGTLQQKIIL